MDLMGLLLNYRQAKGAGRLVVMAQIRAYVQRGYIPDLLNEISDIYDEKFLDVLIGAGMPGALYYAVISQKAKIMGVG